MCGSSPGAVANCARGLEPAPPGREAAEPPPPLHPVHRAPRQVDLAEVGQRRGGEGERGAVSKVLALGDVQQPPRLPDAHIISSHAATARGNFIHPPSPVRKIIRFIIVALTACVHFLCMDTDTPLPRQGYGR